MNTLKTAGVHMVKFLFILPLVAVLLVAFRNGYNDHPTRNDLIERRTLKPGMSQAAIYDTLPGVTIHDKPYFTIHDKPYFTIYDTVPYVTTPNSKGYLIDVIGVNGECTVVVKDKKGKEVERVILNKWKEQKSYEEKYGEILPPPPQPPTPPADVTVAVAPVAAVAPFPLHLVECPVPGMQPPTPVATVGGASVFNLGRISKEWEITDKKAEIKLIDGKIEKYDLTDPKQKADFEKKYGKLVYINTNSNINVATAVGTNLNSNINTTANTVVNIPPTALVEGRALTAAGSPVTVVGYPIATTPLPAGMAITAIDPYGHVITGQEDIVVSITRNTTRQELDKMIAQMKEKGVELSFDEVEFNEKGKLVSINGTMRSGGSRSNFVGTDFDRLILAMIKKGEKVYFKVSTTEREVI
jgi:hypothetical protein